MMDYRVESARALDANRLAIRWNDGLEAIVDFADLIGKNRFFAPLADPETFAKVQVYEFGHTIFWATENGAEIDICPDVLRAKVDPRVAEWIERQESAWRAERAAE